MLEIGVLGGGSLLLWRNYFGPDSHIVGIDIDPRCKVHEADRINVRIGDQTDRDFLAEVGESDGPFDVVIDDGGHTMEQQIISFESLWPHVSSNGMYVCEDSFTSYSPRFHDSDRTFIDAVVKPLVDHIHGWFAADGPTELTKTVSSMHVYAGMVVIEKAAVPAPRYMMKGERDIVYRDIDDLH